MSVIEGTGFHPLVVPVCRDGGYRVLYFIYSLLGTACLPLCFLAALISRLSGNTIFRGFSKRLFLRRPRIIDDDTTRATTIWLHAASVGEVQVAEKLIRELEQTGNNRFFLTAMTRTGHALASERLRGRATCLLAPLDIPWLIRKAIAFIRPDIFVCIETELWPALLTTIRKAGIPMALVNGRLSRRSFQQYKKIAGPMRELLAGFHAIVAIGSKDAQRFAALSGRNDHIYVSGNSKHDGQCHQPDQLAVARTRNREKLGIGDQVVFVCGSTRSGEEELLLPVYQKLRHACNGQLVWIVAPRHLERVDELLHFFNRQGLKPVLYSTCPGDAPAPELVVIDCMGELAELYAAGDYNFCGGSLVSKGGHNIMEIISWGLPVYFGPHMDDFADVASLVVQHGAGFQVSEPDELAELLVRHHNNKELYEQACQAARAVAGQQNMAAAQQAEMIRNILEKQGKRSEMST